MKITTKLVIAMVSTFCICFYFCVKEKDFFRQNEHVFILFCGVSLGIKRKDDCCNLQVKNVMSNVKGDCILVLNNKTG